MRSILFLTSFRNVVVKTVPAFLCLLIDVPLKVKRPRLPSRQSVWIPLDMYLQQSLKLLNISDFFETQALVLVSLPVSLSALSFISFGPSLFSILAH